MKSICKICNKQLRDSGLGRGEIQVNSFKLSEEGTLDSLDQFLDELDMPARYVCPGCGSTYCCDCVCVWVPDPVTDGNPLALRNLECPDCKMRVRLG